MEKQLKYRGGLNMGLIEICSLILICIFGAAYTSKLMVLAMKNNIKANVFGKGVKPKETLVIEKFLKSMTFIGIGIWAVNSLFPAFTERWFVRIYESFALSIIGLSITFIGVLFFILAMIFMKTSWRAGIDKSTRTALVTSGFYSFSRNPAFVGMDLMFMGIVMTFGNVITMLAALSVIVGLHLQILQEEKHMAEMFKREYKEYAKKTPRYLLF